MHQPRKMKYKDSRSSKIKQFVLFVGFAFSFWLVRLWWHETISDIVPMKDNNMVGQLHWEGPHLTPSILLQIKDEVLSVTLSGGDASSVPTQIGLLQKLTNLNLANNKLTEIPSEIGQLRKLEMLGLKNNQLRTLPSEIGCLSNLKAIFLTANKLQALPSQMGNLVVLRKLQAGSNQLRSIPNQFGSLKQLELMRLPMNNLEYLTPSLSQCMSLAWPAFSGNPFADKAKPFIEVNEISFNEISLGTDNLASIEYGGAANDGVITGYLKAATPSSSSQQQAGSGSDVVDIPIVVKYFQSGVSPDGDPFEELLIGAAVMQGTKTVTTEKTTMTTNRHLAYHQTHDYALAIQYGYVKSPRLAAVFRLIPESQPLAKKPLDQVKMLRGRFTHQNVKV
jgi:hypothetical protein